MAARSNYAIWLAYHKSSIVKKKYSAVDNFIWCACNEDKKLENARNILKGPNEEMVKI